MYSLDSAGYIYDASLQIWRRSDYAGIAYSDGDDTEFRIGRIIEQASDISVLSPELSRHCTDWPSLYHLGPQRSNILRPVENCLKGEVLEIGAGCGAISRYLGETGATLLSLEGSPRRASIAASRTRDLDNVTVIAERFDEFRLEQKFDAVTLIGVLEYAAMFSGGDLPALGMLRRIRKMLKPGGRLFIAIENKLGLKYYAGAPEDHVMAPMYGIEDRYSDGPRTFGRKELEALLNSAGFSSSEFCAPFPDYKLPRTIITEEGFNDRSFSSSALIADTVTLDPQLPAQTNFDLRRNWRPVVENGLGLDVANSFLAVATSEHASPALTAGVLAYHYRVDRVHSACKAQVFMRSDEAELFVQTRPMGKNGLQAPPVIRRYAPGTSISAMMSGLISSSHWTIPMAGALVRRYVEAIMKPAGLLPTEGPAAQLLVPETFANATFDNVLLDDSGATFLIGTSLSAGERLEIGSLVWRSLIDLLRHGSGWRGPADSPLITNVEFALTAMHAADIGIDPQQAERYTAQIATWRDSVEMRFESLDRPWQAHNRLDQSACSAETEIQRLRDQLDSQQRAGQELRRELDAVQTSRTWRATAPLRRLVDALKAKHDLKKDTTT